MVHVPRNETNDRQTLVRSFHFTNKPVTLRLGLASRPKFLALALPPKSLALLCPALHLVALLKITEKHNHTLAAVISSQERMESTKTALTEQ